MAVPQESNFFSKTLVPYHNGFSELENEPLFMSPTKSFIKNDDYEKDIKRIEDKIDLLAAKLDFIFGNHVFINEKIIQIKL